MKSKLSVAPITTQFRLKVVCVQCSDEISTVSLFLVCLSLFVFLGVLFVCDTDSTGCEITFHSLFVCLFVCLFVWLFVCFLFVCAYWRLWIVSGGCSVWQMRILEDIIMFSSFRKYFNENLQSTTLSIIFFTMSKEKNTSGDIDVGKSWPFFLSKFGEELGSEMWSWLEDQTEKFEGKDSRSSYRSFNSALESEQR